MALTPALSSLGDAAAEYLDTEELKKKGRRRRRVPRGVPSVQVGDATLAGGDASDGDTEIEKMSMDDVVVICGFGPIGQTVGSLLSSQYLKDESLRIDYVAFDLNPDRVEEGSKRGIKVFYGDGSQPNVLRAAGVTNPRVICVTYTDLASRISSVQRLKEAFPGTPILSRGGVLSEVFQLEAAGATTVIPELSEVSLRLGSAVLDEFGVSIKTMEDSMADLRDKLAARARIQQKRIAKQTEKKQIRGSGGSGDADYVVQEAKVYTVTENCDDWEKFEGERSPSRGRDPEPAITIDAIQEESDEEEPISLAPGEFPPPRSLSPNELRGVFKGVLDEKQGSIQQPREKLTQMQVKELFRRIDSNNDRMLTKMELLDALSQFGFSKERSEVIIDEALSSYTVTTLSGDAALDIEQFTSSIMPILVDQLGVNVCLLPLGEDGLFDPTQSTQLR